MSKIPCQIAVYRKYGLRILNRYEWWVFVEDNNGNLVRECSNYSVTKWGAILAAFTHAGILTFKKKPSSKKVFEYDNRAKP